MTRINKITNQRQYHGLPTLIMTAVNSARPHSYTENLTATGTVKHYGLAQLSGGVSDSVLSACSLHSTTTDLIARYHKQQADHFP